jgi:transposase
MDQQINAASHSSSSAAGDWRKAPRRHYDREFKRILVERASVPGISVSALAQEHGINANLLRIWIDKARSEQRSESAAAHGAPSVSPFVRLTPAPSNPASPGCATAHARLPNGVEIELRNLDAASLSAWLTALHNLPCSASTTR